MISGAASETVVRSGHQTDIPMKFWKKRKSSPAPNAFAQPAPAQREMNDMTNAMLIQNSAMIHRETINTAIDHERGVLEMDTLRQVNQNLISTYDEVLEVRRHGREQRFQAEREMRQMENDLYSKMLEVSTVQMNLSF